MSDPRIIQNFVGYRALIVTDQRAAMSRLDTMLAKLGLTPDYPAIADGRLQLDTEAMDADQDVLFIDTDIDVAINLAPDQKIAPFPVIGIVGVEAPSRLRALMQLGATAILRKPVHGGSVYSALFVGINEFRRRRDLMERLGEHDRRRRIRRHLATAILALMKTSGCDENQAYDRLRRESMRRRVSLEDYCENFIRGSEWEVPLEVKKKIRVENQ